MLTYNIDHVVVRENQVFIYGWGFAPGLSIEKLTLTLAFTESNTNAELNATYGQCRDDVKVKYPNNIEAINAGFSLFAEIDSKDISKMQLKWVLSNRQIITTPIHFIEGFSGDNAFSRLHHYWLLLKKSLILFKNSGIKTTLKKIKNYNKGKPLAITKTTWESLIQVLSLQPLSLVVDHEMGGGSNIYRRQRIEEKISKGEKVLLFGFHIASLQYFIEFYDGQTVTRYSIASIEAFAHLLRRCKIQHILYNGLASFRQPLSAVEMLTMLRKHIHCSLEIVIHDYFAICPSHFLINDKEQFCGVPEINECRRCIKGHSDGFVSISGIRDIDQWRNAWHEFLSVADEVKLFSNASAKLLERAYPRLNQRTWEIVPHKLHTQYPKLPISTSGDLHIGVVGLIGKHKGAQIISNLANEILRNNSTVKITVIGTLEARVSRQVVDVTGPYHPKDLHQLIRDSKANVFLFPSIWAETFSFVAHELVSMDVPLACFNIGAPAELVGTYKKGLLLTSFDPDQMLRELEDFWLKLRSD